MDRIIRYLGIISICAAVLAGMACMPAPGYTEQESTKMSVVKAQRSGLSAEPAEGRKPVGVWIGEISQAVGDFTSALWIDASALFL